MHRCGRLQCQTQFVEPPSPPESSRNCPQKFPPGNPLVLGTQGPRGNPTLFSQQKKRSFKTAPSTGVRGFKNNIKTQPVLDPSDHNPVIFTFTPFPPYGGTPQKAAPLRGWGGLNTPPVTVPTQNQRRTASGKAVDNPHSSPF
ncbi:hypothetical protein TNIN_318391 [Trichonephila inaurata madagascariensis]|uniref:Uncharacterized protein n=1 Tax=Trichonephila inaurata madagascariensis TaxID=2747483 RepID=A0A8X6YPE0_9ARAC|nr:hypothetical protein TNIN_318391 [Trichonephila inaurata madagascariensis]